MLPDRDQYLSNVAQAAVLLFQTRKKLGSSDCCTKSNCATSLAKKSTIFTHTHTQVLCLGSLHSFCRAVKRLALKIFKDSLPAAQSV